MVKQLLIVFGSILFGGPIELFLVPASTPWLLWYILSCLWDGAYKRPCQMERVFLSRTEEPAKAGTCAHDRRALQQLALNVHVKHSDLTWWQLRFPLSMSGTLCYVFGMCYPVCGMCYPVCGMVHIKDLLLLIEKSNS